MCYWCPFCSKISRVPVTGHFELNTGLGVHKWNVKRNVFTPRCSYEAKTNEVYLLETTDTHVMHVKQSNIYWTVSVAFLHQSFRAGEDPRINSARRTLCHGKPCNARSESEYPGYTGEKTSDVITGQSQLIGYPLLIQNIIICTIVGCLLQLSNCTKLHHRYIFWELTYRPTLFLRKMPICYEDIAEVVHVSP